MDEQEARRIGPTWGALSVGILTALVAPFLCHDWYMSGCAGVAAAGCAFWILRMKQVDPYTMNPPATPFKLSREDALVTVKKTLSGRYFRSQEWILKDPDPDDNELKYAYRSNEGGTAAQPQKHERIIILLVRVEPVGQGVGVELSYGLGGGTLGDFYDNDSVPSPDVQEVCKATTIAIMESLKMMELKIAQGG